VGFGGDEKGTRSSILELLEEKRRVVAGGGGGGGKT